MAGTRDEGVGVGTVRTATASLALVVGLVLAGCSGAAPGGDPTPSDSTEDTPGETAEPTPSEPVDTEDPTPPTEPAVTPAPDTLPPGFPDPATLIGQPSHDEQSPDGSWHAVVGGTPLNLVNTLGACFDGGTGDVCAYSMSASVPAGPDGMPGPAGVALLMMLRATGHTADGIPTWEVLDALVIRPPDGAPALVEMCEGTPAMVIYPDPAVAVTDTVAVSAAWGPDADITALVEVDPDTITCHYVGP